MAARVLFKDEAREMSAFLYGRRMYELMTEYWPTAESDPSATPAMLEFALFVHPVIIGAGTRFFPALDDRIALTLIETRTFASGVVMLRYEAVSPAG
jgi:dihydrofolate reductase